jgi:hypothetical protein
MNNLPLEILAPRKSNASKTVFVKSRDGQTQGVCAYYMGAIADILPELKVILNQQENIIPQSITNKSLADLKVATKELSINVTSEVHNNSIIPYWNSQFKKTSKEAMLPDGWKVSHRKTVKHPTITQTKEGDLTIEGAFCGIAHPIDLSRFIGQTVKLSANLISDRPGPYIEFWTTTDIVSPNHRGNNQSEELSVIYTVVPGKNFRIYVGTKSEASFTVKDLNLSIVPQ